MPPEPLPWDRKDFFKERKHERSEQHHPPHPHPHQIGGGGGFGGVGGFGGGPRWREPLHPHPHPYHYASPRWASSDFRYRPPHGEFYDFHVLCCLLFAFLRIWVKTRWFLGSGS